MSYGEKSCLSRNFSIKNQREIFTSFSGLFQAVVKNVTHRISILTAVLHPFFTIF